MDHNLEKQIIDEVKRRETLFRRRLTLSFLDEAQAIKDSAQSLAQEVCLRLDALSSKYQSAIDNYQTDCDQERIFESIGSHGQNVPAEAVQHTSASGAVVPETLDQTFAPHVPIVRKDLHIRLRNGDNKLTDESDYSLWKDRLELELKAHDCIFLLDPSVPPTDDYTPREKNKLKNAVMSYICSNLPEDNQRLVKRCETPKQMIETLDMLKLPNTGYNVFGYLDQFSNMRFDPAKESVLEFLAKFDDLVEKIRKVPDAKFDDFLVRHGLITAIGEACPKIKDHALDKPHMKIKDIQNEMLMESGFVEENVRRDDKRSNSEKALRTSASSRKRPFQGSTTASPNKQAKQQVDYAKKTCTKCGTFGHSESTCGNPGKLCYNCQKYGHLSQDCPHPPTEATIKARERKSQKYPKPPESHTAKKSQTNRKSGVRMPLRKALKSKKSSVRLTVTLDSDTEDLPFDEQMCWVDYDDSEEETVASIATERYSQPSNSEFDKPQGSLMSLFEVPPDILDAGTSSDTEVQEGDNVTLVCSAVGQPTPRIQWRREDGRTFTIFNSTGVGFATVDSFSGEKLELVKVDYTQMGAYLCIASNDIPPAVSKRIVLKVNFAPVARQSNQIVGAVLGSSVNLACNFHAYPSDNTSWHREISEIHEYGGDYKLGVTRSSYDVTLHLTVRNIRPIDFGRYFCSVSNAMGHARSAINLYEIKVETTTLPSSPPTTTTTPDPPTTPTTIETTTTAEPTTTEAMNSNEIEELASLFNDNTKRGAEASSRRRSYAIGSSATFSLSAWAMALSAAVHALR